MSVVFSGTWQGHFISDGGAQTLILPSGADWLMTYNWTQLESSVAGSGQVVQGFWQSGMPDNGMIVYKKTATTLALTTDILPGEVFEFNNTINTPGSITALSAISTATPPRVSTSNTANLYDGAIVRIYNTAGAPQLQGMDFTISNLSTNSHFDLAYMQPLAVAGTTGSYAWIPYNPYFYPNTRYITDITQDSLAIVTLSVQHFYKVGQKVRLVIPQLNATSYGMGPLNELQATIVNVGQADNNGYTNTITIDIDTTSFPAFVFPTASTPLGSRAQVIPFGENTAEALDSNNNILADSVFNNGQMGLILSGGANGPAGSNDDIIYWVAGKSFNV